MTGDTKKPSEMDGSSAASSASNFIVGSKDLRPGDVLLYRPKNPRLHQREISKAIGSPYTHAAIYLGDGFVAESNFPLGVSKNRVEESIGGSQCVAVLRSQLGFSDARGEKLVKFVKRVIEHGKFYDLVGAKNVTKIEVEYFDKMLEIVQANYGQVTSTEDFAKKSFFCSAFVVACFIAVGIIGESAQVAYSPKAFSPKALYLDPAFGWLVGFLIPEGGAISDNDPLLIECTLWREIC